MTCPAENSTAALRAAILGTMAWSGVERTQQISNGTACALETCENQKVIVLALDTFEGDKETSSHRNFIEILCIS